MESQPSSGENHRTTYAFKKKKQKQKQKQNKTNIKERAMNIINGLRSRAIPRVLHEVQ